MSKARSGGMTRQGVRDLNSLGTPVRQTLRKRWTCPPHLPADHWEYDEWRLTRLLRCRSCGDVIDSEPVSW